MPFKDPEKKKEYHKQYLKNNLDKFRINNKKYKQTEKGKKCVRILIGKKGE